MKIVIPEIIDTSFVKVVNKLKEFGDIKYYQDYPKSKNDLIRRTKDAEVLLVKWVDFDEEVLENCPHLKTLITLTSGYAHFPLQKARERGVDIINCPTHNSQAVVEHVLALMFAVSRQVVNAQINIQKGLWRETTFSYQGTELAGKKLGIVGYGNVGQILAKMAGGIGMTVVYVNSKSSKAELDDLIKTSDYISLNVPRTDTTYHLINKEKLASMKPTAYLINTSRGEIIDQKELLKVLKKTAIAGAGLDVFEGSIAVGKAPKEVVELAKLPNVVATPHIAFNTKEAAERMGEELIENLKAVIKGNPVNVVN